MLRRVIFAALCVLCVLPLASSASAVNGRDNVANLQQKVANANRREGVLTSSIAAENARIHTLQGSVASVESKLAGLRVEVARAERSLARVRYVFDQQSSLLALAQRQYDATRHRLAQRLVAVYESDRPDAVAVMLSARNLSNAVDRLEYLGAVTEYDNRVAREAQAAKTRISTIRNRTGRLLARIGAETQTVAQKASEVLQTRDRLSSTRDRLRIERNSQQKSLASVRESKAKWIADIAALQAGSADIAARIRAGGSHSSATPSAAGLIWPVQGVLTSPFGMRWGRMHEGIDIGASTGTPIYAAAGGTVIYAGWEGGYGNLTVIDHGGGLATAYGHQSQIAVSNGQTVSRGQAIGYVGSTGHSTGPHLHFEVRVNGTPENPLNYLS